MISLLELHDDTTLHGGTTRMFVVLFMGFNSGFSISLGCSVSQGPERKFCGDAFRGIGSKKNVTRDNVLY